MKKILLAVFTMTTLLVACNKKTAAVAQVAPSEARAATITANEQGHRSYTASPCIKPTHLRQMLYFGR